MSETSKCKPKPPLGVVPERLWKSSRLTNLEKVIEDRLGTEFEILPEWVTERNNLLKELSTPLSTED